MFTVYQTQMQSTNKGNCHIGEILDDDDLKYSWVYDCGDIQYAYQIGQVDYIFLSHFDADHIAGANLLLQNNPKAKLIMPCLSEDEKFYIILHGLKKLNDTDLSLFNNNDNFIEVKKERVIPLPLGKIIWIFDTFVVRKENIMPKGCRSFISGIKQKFNLKNIADLIKFVTQSQKNKKAIIDEYKKVGFPKTNTANIISMCLYSGEETNHCSSITYLHVPLCSFCRRKRLASGWLHTGDSKLIGEDRDEFLNYYEKYINQVGTFVLPHHGSKNSRDFQLLQNFSHSQWVIPFYNKVVLQIPRFYNIYSTIFSDYQTITLIN